jgi:A/G-specific adenine glycosylase
MFDFLARKTSTNLKVPAQYKNIAFEKILLLPQLHPIVQISLNTIENSHLLTTKLIDWYERNRRDLPWRNTTNPYPIWLSEVILQQTRVQQGLPYYQRFVENFPTVEALAAAPEQEVLRLWQGLGYYSRARNLHACARVVVAQWGGSFPSTYRELLSLPGIGRYTAAAIASFAFKEVVPVVDGNVYRVLARLFGETTDIAHSGAFDRFFALAQLLLDRQRPDLFNQALMEFGALQCTPLKPLCLYCPLKEHCWAYAHGQQAQLPVKRKKAAVRSRYLHYMVLEDATGRLLMGPRAAGDIWQGLFDFYLLEDEKSQQINAFSDALVPQLLQLGVPVLESPEYRHLLSHQRLHARFFHFKLGKVAKKQLALPPDMKWYSPEQVQQLPKPVLIQNYLIDAGF